MIMMKVHGLGAYAASKVTPSFTYASRFQIPSPLPPPAGLASEPLLLMYENVSLESNKATPSTKYPMARKLNLTH